MGLGSVLVLDENKEQAQRIASMLHQQKWTSVLSFDQQMAMRILKGGRFHLLLFDAYAKGNNTLHMMDDIRAEAQDAPLAIMSDGGHRSAALNAAMNAARVAGADFVIAKPFNPEKLKNLLDDANRYHRARAKERHVLVVDDDADLRRDVVRVLQQVGYKVSWAANMEDVFFDHNLGMVDVVLTAVLIPGIGGIEGTAQIKKEHPHVKIIAMSQGVDDVITAVHVLSAAQAAGADALLAKPFHMPELLRAMTSLIRAPDAPAENAKQAAIDALFD
jgi:DNA-binding response OmpR family regulator